MMPPVAPTMHFGSLRRRGEARGPWCWTRWARCTERFATGWKDQRRGKGGASLARLEFDKAYVLKGEDLSFDHFNITR